ncbi:MAG: hypothetical protein ABL900_15880 [Burkholderiaceae bacterium]
MIAQTKATVHDIGKRRLMLYGLIACAALAALALTTTVPRAADAAAAGPTAKNPQVTFEALPSGVKRITLSEKAAQRLGIATDTVGEQTVIRRQMVGGLVIPPMDPKAMPNAPGNGKGSVFGKAQQVPAAPAPTARSGTGAKLPSVGFGGFAGGAAALPPSALKTVAAPMAAAAPVPPPSATGDVWVLISLSAAEWERTAKDKPVRLLALGTRAVLPGELLAQPSGLPPTEDPKRSMLSVYYIVPGKDHGLEVNSRMRVELPMLGTEEKQKVVPYSSIYYDGKGTPWVYVTSKPLVYERQRVAIERVAGNLAVLSEGPAAGTSIVSVGASLLFGTEIFGK